MSATLVHSTAVIPKHQVRFSQMYIVAWATIAVAASIGACDQYQDGPVSTQVLSYTGTVCAGVLLLGIMIEAIEAKRPTKDKCLDWLFSWMSNHNVPDRGVHIAVQLLTITSTGIAFINMHEENWNWQFGFSTCLLILVFIYNVLYTPSVLLSTAAYQLHKPEWQTILGTAHASTAYVWKKSYVEDRLMPST
jgi:hypothetical protein